MATLLGRTSSGAQPSSLQVDGALAVRLTYAPLASLLQELRAHFHQPR